MNKHKIYHELNNKLSYLSDNEIQKMIINNKIDKYKKWGLNKIITFNDHKIFIKAIPLSKLFYDNPFDTSNLYDIPAYYNFGFGSAGINPYRELLLHIKTTNYILSNKCDFFPLLYHYRIIYDDNNENIYSGLDRLDRWDNNENIKIYLKDRIKSKYKIVLFLEYIPYVAYEYLENNYNFISNFYEQSNKIIKFCNKNGLLHNDAHLGNFIIDENKKVYLTDFGLSLDEEFKLDKYEKKFMKYNHKLDIYYIKKNIINDYLENCYRNKIIDKYKLNELNGLETDKYLLYNIDIIKNDINISKFQIDFINKNKSFFIKYNIWKYNFIDNNNKDKNYIIKL